MEQTTPLELTLTAPDAVELGEDPAFLSEQLITYLGNKRGLLDFIGRGIETVKSRLGKKRLRVFDVFSGSGIVARYLKQHADCLYVNDIESYATIINQCYLTNRSQLNLTELREIFDQLKQTLVSFPLRPGFICELYAPRNERCIKAGERVFYTRRNAQYLDTARQLIADLPGPYQKYFLAPLLAEASIHANTSGVFKGFYKSKQTGIGMFGGTKQDALSRIMGNMDLPFPLFSRFETRCVFLEQDAWLAAAEVPLVDLAYLDPPYNQHPYGSNYFMLNLLATYRRPEALSPVSGIPAGWNRSAYNRRGEAAAELTALLEAIQAKFLLISFNSEGFISVAQMLSLLNKIGRVTVLETRYNTFRGSRNLRKRNIHLKEYLYLVEK